MAIKDDIDTYVATLPPEDTATRALFRRIKNELENLEVLLSAERYRTNVLEEGLRVYSNKNFWIRVPPYTLAQADKGERAAKALREAYSKDNPDNA